MKVEFVSPGAAKGAAAVAVFNDLTWSAAAADYNKSSGDALKKAADSSRFTGGKGQSLEVLAPGNVEASRILVLGAGDKAEFDTGLFGGAAAKAALLSGEETLTLHLDGLNLEGNDAANAAMGAVLAAYRFDKYRTRLSDSKKPSLKTVRVAIEKPKSADKAYNDYYGPVAEGVYEARDLMSEPGNILNPESYAARIKEMKDIGLKIEVLGEKKMAALGMNSLLSVGNGSEFESQLAIMHWNGGPKDEPPVLLVGKGVTFDAGGISLKPGAGMWDMKGDMGGSAAVVGTMKALAKRKAKANVIGIVGLVENMPDSKATRPGDIVTSMSGQTIEIQNTDAEGRLVLADAMWYGQEKFNPKAMVNLATLTGAIIISLGHENAGVFSNSDMIAEQLGSAAKVSGEAAWRMPMGDGYNALLDSENADMKNIGGRAAGSITAAQFLGRFVKETTPWAHIDIAGMAWKDKRRDPREPVWATGYGVQLLNRWIKDSYES